MSTEIAQTILQQLGGGRFAVMTGAKGFVGGDNTLTFKLPASLTKKRANGMLIRLDPSDTYTLELRRWDGRKLEHKVLDSRSDIYCENLRQVFTDMTGLDTRL